MSAPHIAIDCRTVDPHFPGIGRATLETVRAMAQDAAPARLSLLVGPGTVPDALRAVEQSSGGLARLVRVPAALRAPADQWTLPRLLRRLQPDLYHATYYAVPLAVPVPLVVTVYDLIPRLFPHYWPNPLVRHGINLWTAYAARRAVRVIVSSESTADDATRLLPGCAAKVRVVPLGVARRPLARPAAPAHPPYLLYVGSNKPHKNLPRLVAAFARIASHTPTRLVIAGAWDERYPEAREEAIRHGLQERVVFEHRPSDARLDELYGGAAGFVFPSLYEGFGLPVLEAMAAGLPVATSGRGSLREVASGAALLFDPEDTADMAGAMRRLLEDGGLRERLSVAGLARAAQFPWQRTAQETRAVYDEITR